MWKSRLRRDRRTCLTRNHSRFRWCLRCLTCIRHKRRITRSIAWSHDTRRSATRESTPWSRLVLIQRSFCSLLPIRSSRGLRRQGMHQVATTRIRCLSTWPTRTRALTTSEARRTRCDITCSKLRAIFSTPSSVCSVQDRPKTLLRSLALTIYQSCCSTRSSTWCSQTRATINSRGRVSRRESASSETTLSGSSSPWFGTVIGRNSSLCYRLIRSKLRSFSLCRIYMQVSAAK